MLEVGEKAPDFTVSDSAGKEVSLKDFRGKTVVMWFYPMAMTPGCSAEGCAFRDLSAEFAKKNAVILGVSFNSPTTNAMFARKNHFTFPLLCDTKREIGLAYGACSSKAALTAKRIGVVIDAQGRISKLYPKVSAKQFPAQVLAELS